MVYSTKQRKTLMAYLAQHADENLAAGQIADALADKGVSISAVYRNLATLEQSGQVRRVVKSGSREALYRYADAEGCKSSLHLSCQSCGKTFHMHSEQADALIHAIADQTHFAVDRTETVLYGVCDNCRQSTRR